MTTSDVIIRAEGLGKKYRISHQQQERYTALRDVIAENIRGIFRGSWRRTGGQPATEDFWALKDACFEVKRGDVLGIIGRNGAGKSTLLKILSRITEPTEGRVELSGRVASLLEVGTGFHPELTGRENVYLNGAILGMSRVEIRRKFDEIVAFAEVEKFLDTPVKRYSSGMYVRLAFAVAAHLEPEILIVDEVLAVGDAEFQKKCLGKMREVSRGGRTVLFVSHNMAAVQALCEKAMYLHSGGVRGIGSAAHWIKEYLGDSTSHSASRLSEPVKIDDNLTLEVLEISPDSVECGRAVRFRVEVSSRESARLSEMSMLLYTPQGFRLGILDFRSAGLPKTFGIGETWSLSGTIDRLLLVEGEYSAGLYVMSGSFSGDFLDLVKLTVHPDTTSRGYVPYPAEHRGLLSLEFNVDAISSSRG